MGGVVGLRDGCSPDGRVAGAGGERTLIAAACPYFSFFPDKSTGCVFVRALPSQKRNRDEVAKRACLFVC